MKFRGLTNLILQQQRPASLWNLPKAVCLWRFVHRLPVPQYQTQRSSSAILGSKSPRVMPRSTILIAPLLETFQSQLALLRESSNAFDFNSGENQSKITKY